MRNQGALRRRPMSMVRPLRALVLLGAFLAGSTMGAASAHDHKPPRLILTSGATEQRGQLGPHCGTSAGEDPAPYQALCADYLWSFPKAKGGKAGREATITTRKSTPADELDI